MPRSLLKFLPFVLFFINCNFQPTKPKPAAPCKDTTAIIWPDTPDCPMHIAPLLAFFERHKSDSAFDTVISFTDQGFGPIDNFYNFIEAGQLYSKTQLHALVWYDIGTRDGMPLARMIVYKKNAKGDWVQVLNDTTIVSDYHFHHYDWNNDGIGDLSYVIDGWYHGGHGPITWYLWLVDKNGDLHAVKGFDNLNDPKIDSHTHHIFTNTLCDHSSMWHEEYKFSGFRISKLCDIYTDDLDNPTGARYYRNKKFIKRVENDSIYIPQYEPQIYDD